MKTRTPFVIALSSIAAALCLTSSASVPVPETAQKATVVIDGAYKPEVVTVKVGSPVEITFVRKEKAGCGGTVVVKELKFRKDVASGGKVVLKFTPKKAGTIPFQCGMGMLHGKIVVK